MAKKRSRVKKALRKEVNIHKEGKGKFSKKLTKKRSFVPAYFRNSWRELKKVTWPNRKESWRLVLAVVVFTAFFTVLTVLADLAFNELVERIIL